MKTFKESDLSLSAKQFLLDQGCTDVYGEVRDIDLVGKNGSLLIGIELKKSLNITVLEQAAKRIAGLNYVYIGIPRNRFKTYHQLSPVYKLFIEQNKLGIVLLDPVRVNDDSSFIYYEVVKHPKINRLTPMREWITNDMTEFTKDRLGGQASSEVFTPYKFMLEEIKDFLRNERNRHGSDGWTTIDKLALVCQRVRKHYANPKASLYQLLNRYSWIEKSECNKKYRYKITEER